MKKIQSKYFEKTNRKMWQSFLWSKFLGQFSHGRSKMTINSLFSVHEKEIIANRLAAIILIRQGTGTREIERLIWVSRATISALRKAILGKAKSYDSPRSFRRLVDRKNIIVGQKSTLLPNLDFLKDIDLFDLLKNPPSPKGLGITGRGITR